MITLSKFRVFWTHSIISGHWWQNEMLFDQGSFKVDAINFHSTRSLTWKRIIIFVQNRSETAETTFMYFRVKNETGYNHNRRLFCFEMTVHFFTKVQPFRFNHQLLYKSKWKNEKKKVSKQNFKKIIKNGCKTWKKFLKKKNRKIKLKKIFEKCSKNSYKSE